jgi:hypothetical protein
MLLLAAKLFAAIECPYETFTHVHSNLVKPHNLRIAPYSWSC